jgi:hypothetical protein
MSQSSTIVPFVRHGRGGRLCADDAVALFKEWETSSLREADFLRLKGLNTHTLSRWRKILERLGISVPTARHGARPVRVPELVPVRVRREPAPTPTLAAPETHFELLLERGRVLRIPPRFESDALQRLLVALEATS